MSFYYNEITEKLLPLLKQNSKRADDIIKKHGDDGIDFYLKHGDDAASYLKKYGDDVIDIFKKYGDDGVNVIRKHGDDAVNAIRKYGDTAYNAINKYGDDAVDAFEKYGDDAAEGFENGKTPGEITDKKSATIINETDKYIDYCNEAGTKIRITKQDQNAINNSIRSKLSKTNSGDYIEGKVGDYIQQSTDCQLTDFANKVKDGSGNQIGDIDCATKNALIEIKKSASSLDPEQFDKYCNPKNNKYFNFDNKKVILYIDTQIDTSNTIIVEKINEVKDKGVIVVNSLEDLKGVLE